LDAIEEIIWHKQVPLKVYIFVWRLLRDRLSIKTNLVTRDIITQRLIFVCLVVEVLNQLNTYFSLVAALAPFGRQSGLGLVSRWLTRTISHITFFSSLIQKVVLDTISLFATHLTLICLSCLK
jgi:hypothetical protein